MVFALLLCVWFAGAAAESMSADTLLSQDLGHSVVIVTGVIRLCNAHSKWKTRASCGCGSYNFGPDVQVYK